MCELRPLFQAHTGGCGILGDVKGHSGKCGDEVRVCTGTEIIRWGAFQLGVGGGERLLCFLLEEEGILSRGVMSTTASICTFRLHGNMTHLATTRETDAEFRNIGAGWGVVVVVMGG